MKHFHEVSGHVFRREGRRSGPVWYAKYRLPDGRQCQRRIGPAWTQRGRPAAGFFTKRTAEAWLADVLDQARAGTLPGMVRTNATVEDACQEWLRYSGARVLAGDDARPAVFGARPHRAGVRLARRRGRVGP